VKGKRKEAKGKKGKRQSQMVKGKVEFLKRVL